MGIVSTAVGKFRTTLLIMVFLVIMGSLGRAAALPSEPIITRNTMINSVVLNLPTAVETIPIIYRETEFTSSPSLTKPCPATTMLASSGKPVTHAPATVSIKIWTV